MFNIIESCLMDLESRIDDTHEQSELKRWQHFLDGYNTNGIFVPAFRKPSKPMIEWPEVDMNSALEDPDLMVYHQFKTCSDLLAEGHCSRLNIRCNYGTGILPTMFGCELLMMDKSRNQLPAAIPLGSREKIKALVDKGVPDLNSGQAKIIFQTAEQFLEIFDMHPMLARNIAFYHPDLQGPIDAAEIIWGSDIFYAFYDDMELLRDFLKLVTDTYILFMKKWFTLVPQRQVYSTHWGLMFKGKLMIRNDSLMNLAAQTYIDFIRPFDQRLLDEFGGGAIHFCGRGDHYVEAMSSLRGLTAVNLTQPELNDMEIIYRNTVDKGIKLVGLDIKTVENSDRDFRGQVQCFCNRTEADSKPKVSRTVCR